MRETQESVLRTYHNAVEERNIPPSRPLSVEQLVQEFWPVVDALLNGAPAHREGARVVGIQGPTGVGKTTLAKTLCDLLVALGYKAQTLSIDDFYLSLQDREVLARRHADNPFYQIWRGMPGTHYVDKLRLVLQKAREGKPFTTPRFDKSLHAGKGDVTEEGVTVLQPLDFLVVEGWCLYMENRGVETFKAIVQKNEYVYETFTHLDPAGAHVEVVLAMAEPYKEVWDLIDDKILLVPESVTYIEEWRLQQEEETKRLKGSGLMPAEVVSFAKHFIPFSYYISEVAGSGANSKKIMVGKNHMSSTHTT